MEEHDVDDEDEDDDDDDDDDKLPWEWPIPEDGPESICDERCDFCQLKEKSRNEAEPIQPKPFPSLAESTEDLEPLLAIPNRVRRPSEIPIVRLPPQSNYPKLLL